MNLQVDVAIVGAGISGLTAAWELHKLGIESFVVLEARSRVGGRTFNQAIAGSYFEQGGTWAGPDHTELLALAAELGIATKPGQRDGEFLGKIDGRWTSLTSSTAFSSPQAQQDFAQVLAAFERLRRSLPETVWQASNAKPLDALTMQTWIEQNTTTLEARTWFAGCIRQVVSGSLDQVSLLWMLHFFNTCGDKFLGLNAEAEGIRFVGGSQQLSLNIAAKLGVDCTARNRVWLEAPVRQITGYASDQIRLTSEQGIVGAKAAIVAMMPKEVGNIEFDPPLPPLHRQLNAEWATKSWVKFYAVYEKPFWHSQTTGSHFLDFDTGFDVYDVSPEDGSQGLIVGLLPPNYAPLSTAERQTCCRNFLAETFGELARYPQALVEFDWHQQAWTGGCVSVLPPDVLSQIGAALNQPVGHLYWAGTERSLVWTNYIEGAIRAGKAAARQVAQKL